VEDQSQCAALAAAQARDAVTDLHSRRAAQTLYGTFLDRNDSKRTLAERQHHGCRLSARTLLDQDQFSALKVDSGPVQLQYGLQRKMDVAV
jgi:hypothetical protein